MKKFILIDGNAILHRAYHAMPDLTHGKEPVNAVYGFFAMLLNIIQDQNPDYLAVCFDRSKPTIRQSMYAGYHAHRPQMADDLFSQIKKLDALLDAMKVSIFALDGYEGDDLIGTIATRVTNGQKTQNTQQASKSVVSENQKVRKTDKAESLTQRDTEFSESSEEIEVVIVTGDRDMLQLVNSKVKVLMPVTGLTKTALFDEAAVEDKYGVTPAQFIDYKALIGDASDGYPGVTGIGPKTAANLLREFGTFENLYQNMPQLPEKISLKLATDAEQAALAKKLATIITDAPMQFSIEDCSVSHFDIKALRSEFEKLSFKSLLARLDSRYPQVVKAQKVAKEEAKKKEDGQLGLL